MSHKLEHLNYDDVVINHLTIHAFEMGIYLAQVDFDGRNEYIVGADNRPRVFKNVSQVQNELNQARIKSISLVHQSPYDEMIGNDDSASHQLQIKLK